jgi:hypothetical protein
MTSHHTEAKLPEILEDTLRLLAASMRHSAGQWMVPGWDGNCIHDVLQRAESALKARDAEIERLRGDAERYQWLCANYGETKLPCMLEPAIGDYIADGKASIDAAIDQARATGGETANG